jgi:hypothetical protein
MRDLIDRFCDWMSGAEEARRYAQVRARVEAVIYREQLRRIMFGFERRP